MSGVIISEEMKSDLLHFLNDNKGAGLVPTFLYYLEKKFDLHPVLFVRDKIIFQSSSDAVKVLEKEGKLYHQAEILINFSNQGVNEQTKRVYICPFTGKVFADNTHPNPQDAIYDWVSRCPENKERIGGLRVKRFFVSEDPDVIKNFIPKDKPKDKIAKVVFSSRLNNRLFGTKEGVLEDFKKNYLKPLTLLEVQSQNKYQLEEQFLNFIQKQLVEDKVAGFVEALSDVPEMASYVSEWISEE